MDKIYLIARYIYKAMAQYSNSKYTCAQ